MESLKGLAKGGWHPPGRGTTSTGGKTKESWRGDFKGIDTVAKWMGKEPSSSSSSSAASRAQHQSKPLSRLKDPASFGPPPRHVAVTGATSPDAAGYGGEARPGGYHLNANAPEEEYEEAEEEPPKQPPRPYRADTTGLSTANLPKPPVRRVDATTSSPTSYVTSNAKPQPPPRLPPRQNSHPDAHAPSPPPTYNAAVLRSPVQPARDGYLNQDSVARLGRAGVSIPDLGIGTQSSRAAAPSQNLQLGELQSRFARQSLGSRTPSQDSAQGTTWAQKQAALKTATAFRTNPSSVSLSDARNAASTANNFRQRHGEQVASAWQKSNTLNTPFPTTNRDHGTDANHRIQLVDHGDDSAGPPFEASSVRTAAQPTSPIKKAPPPPPKKKELSPTSPSAGGPPPLPLSSKPRP